MAVERNDFILGVGSDTSGIRKYLSELAVVPQAVGRISREINKIQLGDGRKFEGDAKALAQALIRGFRSELAGGTFQRALTQALKGTDLRVPDSAKASLRRDLQQIAKQIREAIPQQVRIGVEAKTDIRQLVANAGARVAPQTGGEGQDPRQVRAEARALRAAAREAKLAEARQDASDARLDTEQTRRGTLSLAEQRAQARQLRSQTARARKAASQGPTPIVEDNLLDESLVQQDALLKRARQQAARRAALKQGAVEAGLLPNAESQVLDQVARREERGQAARQRAGRIEEQAYAEDARRTAARQSAQDRADRESQRALERQAAAQKRAAAEAEREAKALKRKADQAERDLARQARQADVNERRMAVLQSQAIREDERRATASRQRSGDSSQEALLFRATEAERARRAELQRLSEGVRSKYFEGPEQFNSLFEGSQLRRRQAAAEQEALRQRGGLGNVRAGLVGFGGMGTSELVTRIFTSGAIYNSSAQAFGMVTQAVSELARGTLDFEQSLSGLSLTFDQGKGSLRGFATEVGAIANQTGLTQAQGVEVASRSVGLFGTGDLSLQQKKDFASQATQVTGRIAKISGSEDLVSVETSLAGILRAFELSNADITRVEDAIAVISKRSGANPADLAQAGAQTGLLARQAGFDLYQSQAIVANQTTTTGQSALTASELLTQVFAQATNPAVKSRLQSIGVNTDGTTLADQIAQLSKGLKEGRITEGNLANISSAFGRSRGGAALVNIVKNYDTIQQRAAEASSSPGEGERQFKQLMSNISAELTKMVGALKNLATEIAQSGLLDFIALLVKGVTLTAEALTEALKLFNELPRGLRTTLFALGELSLALYLLRGRLGAATAVVQLMSLAGTRLGSTRVGQAVVSRVAGEAAAAQVARRADALSAFGGVRGAAAGAAGDAKAALPALLTNPATIAAVGALSAVLIAKNVTDAGQAADRQAGVAAEKAAGANDAVSLREAASEKRRQAELEQARQDSAFGLGGFFDLVSGGNAKKNQAAAEEAARTLDARAKTLEAADAAAKQAAGGFGRFTSVDDVTEKLALLSEAGYTTAQQIDLLNDAFARVEKSANSTATAVILQGEGQRYGQGVATIATKAIDAGRAQADLRQTSLDPYTEGDWRSQLIGAFMPADENYQNAKKFREARNQLARLDQGKLQDSLSKTVNETLLARGKDASKGDITLNDADVAAVNEAVSKQVDATVGPILKDIDPEIRKAITNSLKVGLQKQVAAFKPNPLDTSQYFDNFMTPLFTKLAEQYSKGIKVDRLGAANEQAAAMRQAIAKGRAEVDKSLAGLDERGVTLAANDPNSYYNQGLIKLQKFQEQLDEAEREQAAAQLERARALSKLRESKLGVSDQAGRAAEQISALRLAVNAAKDPTDKALAQAELNERLNQEFLAQLDRMTSARRALIDPRDSAALAAAANKDAQARLGFMRSNGDQKAIDDATTALAEARNQERQTLLAVSSARRLSRVQPGDAVAAAQAVVQNAEAEKNAQLRGTQAYYDALVKVRDARRAVVEAQLARAKNRDLLSIDLTDPVAQADAEVRAARRNLGKARGADERDQAKLDLRNAQNSAEAAKFNQRLSDVQTAEQLGRISHQAYIQYLQSEHNRLSSISKRTRQQQEQLDQVDRLMKEAADSIQGQFNLGDIKLPTVYQVRRAIQQGTPGAIQAANNGFSGAANGQVLNDNSQRILTIQGVSIEEVMKRITSLFNGKPVTASTNRKV